MIEIKNCTVTYAAEPNHRVLKDISLTIEDGEFVLLTGESGCGKTTILRLMNGLIPYFYDANVEGGNIYRWSQRRAIYYLRSGKDEWHSFSKSKISVLYL